MKYPTIFVAAFGIAAATTFVVAETFGMMMDIGAIPLEKRTNTAYYMSSQSVFDLLETDPTIVFLDVRGVKEIEREGHPEGISAIVPVRVESEEWVASLGEYKLVENPNFRAGVDSFLAETGRSKHDMLILTCGSGMRSAVAARVLEDAGFTNVWHIPDGYEGDDKPGLNSQNAWKNKGLPWSDGLSAAVYGVEST